MIEFISFLIFLFFFFILLTSTIKYKVEIFSLRREVLRSNIEKNIIAEKLLTSSLKDTSMPIQQNDGFLKFVSDSRDWAFEYIETVQSGLQDFISDVDPYIEYWDTYHEVMQTPLDLGMEKIYTSYKRLKELLPSDYGKIDT